jgi:hypothetical protein
MRAAAYIPDTAARHARDGDARAFLKMARHVALTGGLGSAWEAFAADPANAQYVKSAVSAGSLGGTTWAEPLASMSNAFLAVIRARSAFGRMSADFRRVPLNVRTTFNTTAAAASWLGEGQQLRFSAGAFDYEDLEPRKLTAAVALSQDLMKFAADESMSTIERDMGDSLSKALDDTFLDPAQGGTDSTPSSITAGVTPIIASGTDAAAFRRDATDLVALMVAAGGVMARPVWVMSPTMALSLALADGGLLRDGKLAELPVLTTLAAATTDASSPTAERIFLVDTAAIVYGDDGLEIDSARHASVQMDSAPDSPPTASTVPINLWQHNMVAIKAVRLINWAKVNAGAAGFITGASYGR